MILSPIGPVDLISTSPTDGERGCMFRLFVEPSNRVSTIRRQTLLAIQFNLQSVSLGFLPIIPDVNMPIHAPRASSGPYVLFITEVAGNIEAPKKKLPNVFLTNEPVDLSTIRWTNRAGRETGDNDAQSEKPHSTSLLSGVRRRRTDAPSSKNRDDSDEGGHRKTKVSSSKNDNDSDEETGQAKNSCGCCRNSSAKKTSHKEEIELELTKKTSSSPVKIILICVLGFGVVAVIVGIIVMFVAR